MAPGATSDHARAQPLYREIVSVLTGDIAAGRFPVGTRLPTEAMLCRRFAASRHTVRAALKACQDAGLIQRRQGSGSVVVADRPQPRFAASIGSLEDLMQYAAATRLEVLEVAPPVPADRLPPLPAAGGAGISLGGQAGQGAGWIRVVALRRDDTAGAALARTEIWLPERHAAVIPDIGVQRLAVCQLIERRGGPRIAEVRQDIEAAAADDATAAALGLQPGGPVLRIARLYLSAAGEAVEIAISHHPPGHFRYGLALRRTV